MQTPNSLEAVKTVLGDALALSDARIGMLNADSALLGSMPELDSMAVVHVIGGLEEHFAIAIDDDEIDARIFESVGSLAAFVDSKLG